MLLKSKLKLPDKARRVLADRLGSLVDILNNKGVANDGSDDKCDFGEELQTINPNLSGLVKRFRSNSEKIVPNTLSVSEIMDADEKRSELAYELSKEKINLEKLQRIASRGLPDDSGNLRATAWKLLLRYLPTSRDMWEKEQTENRSKYAKLKEEFLLNPSKFSKENYEASSTKELLERRDISNEDHPLRVGKTSIWHQYFQFAEILEQIDRDVNRTHPDMKFFSGNSVFSRKNREAMRNILLLFAKLNPAVGYVQGMNEILAPLYFVFLTDTDGQNAVNNAEVDSFWCFVKILSDSVDHFCEQLDNSSLGIHSTLSRLLDLLKINDEELWDIFKLQHRWITLLLTQEFDFKSIFKIWDSLLSNPFGVQEMLLRVCCSMLLCVKSEILSGDFVANLKLLQNYPYIDMDHILHVAHYIKTQT